MKAVQLEGFSGAVVRGRRSTEIRRKRNGRGRDGNQLINRGYTGGNRNTRATIEASEGGLAPLNRTAKETYDVQLVGHVPASLPWGALPASTFSACGDVCGCTAHPGQAQFSPHVQPSRVISIAVGKVMMLGRTRSLIWSLRAAASIGRERMEGNVLEESCGLEEDEEACTRAGGRWCFCDAPFASVLECRMLGE